MANEEKREEIEDWQVDWEGHRLWQLTATMHASPAQRLAWLEEMIGIAHRSGVLARRRGGS